MKLNCVSELGIPENQSFMKTVMELQIIVSFVSINKHFYRPQHARQFCFMCYENTKMNFFQDDYALKILPFE